jgi:hypothetical protein
VNQIIVWLEEKGFKVRGFSFDLGKESYLLSNKKIEIRAIYLYKNIQDLVIMLVINCNVGFWGITEKRGQKHTILNLVFVITWRAYRTDQP